MTDFVQKLKTVFWVIKHNKKEVYSSYENTHSLNYFWKWDKFTAY